VDIRKVKKLIDLVKSTGIAELEIKEGGKEGEESVRISLVKHGETRISQAHYEHSPSLTQGQVAVETSEEKKPAEGHAVKSPMVGTVYLAPSPGTPLFVQVGQKVNKGDTLCIIEAMKMFNKVESDIDGTVSACLVENGQAVEFEQTLFVLEEERH
jgi:acetyl-CoA carboxylase biotin carboxyl carrier protein